MSASPTLVTPRAPRPAALRFFESYVRAQFGRHFASVRLAPLPEAGPGWDPQIPSICIANHTNWWDGFLGFLVGRALGVTSHVLMDATQLGRYPLFRLVGALPLRRDSARQAYQDLLAARACLVPGRALWIFPQGDRRPDGERPRLLGGAAGLALAHGSPIRICPVAFRYRFVSEQLPEAFAWVGRPWVLEPARYADRRSLTPVLTRDLLVTLDSLDGALAAEHLTGFRVLVAGRLSVNKRMDRLRHALGLLRGRFEARNG